MRRLLPALAALGFLVVAPTASAQQLTYQPTNPAFGGSPLNYSWMIQSATLQNTYEEESAPARNPIDDFAGNLQRQILNQLSRELITSRFGDLDLDEPGTFNLGDFQIEITPGIDGVSIRLFNLLTGEETIVTIPNSL